MSLLNFPSTRLLPNTRLLDTLEYTDDVCKYCKFSISDALMPYFPENVDNATIQIGQSAELKCTVENLNNYKVKSQIIKSVLA